MALTRFGDVAFDWSRVYLIRVIQWSFDAGKPMKVAVFADVPGAEIGAPLFTLEYASAIHAWQKAKGDKRLTSIDTDNPLAIDMSKVVGVSLNSKQDKAHISLDLGGNRGVAMLEFDHWAARHILNRLTEAPQ